MLPGVAFPESGSQLEDIHMDPNLMPGALAKPSSVNFNGQLQKSILDLLSFYNYGTAAPSAASSTGSNETPAINETTQPIAQISIGDALAKEQEACVAGFRPPGVLLPPPPGLGMQSEYECSSPRSGSPRSQSSIADSKRAFDWIMTPPPGLHLSGSQRADSSICSPEREQKPMKGAKDLHMDSDMKYARDLAAAGGGLSGYTTVMMQQIPFKYTQRQLMNEINDAGFAGSYDFLYLPVDAKNPGNRGFGFINFLSARLAQEFYSRYFDQHLAQHEALAPLVVIPSDVQGFEQSAACFFASWDLRKKKRHSQPVFLKPVPAHIKESARQKGRAQMRDALCGA